MICVYSPPHSVPCSLSYLLNTHNTRPNTYYHVVQKPLQVPKTFPKIFSPKLTANGLLTPEESKSGIMSLPVGASLQSNSSIHNTIATLLAAVKHINIKRYHSLTIEVIWFSSPPQVPSILHQLSGLRWMDSVTTNIARFSRLLCHFLYW